MSNYIMKDSNNNPITVCKGGMQEILKLRGQITVLTAQTEHNSQRKVITLARGSYSEGDVEFFRRRYPNRTIEFVLEEE